MEKHHSRNQLVQMVSGQLAPKTIRPGRIAPESTNFTMFLLFVFYRGFLRTIQYYMFLLFTSYKRFSAVLKLKFSWDAVRNMRTQVERAARTERSYVDFLLVWNQSFWKLKHRALTKSSGEAARRESEPVLISAKFSFPPRKPHRKKAKLIFITTCYRTLITSWRRKTVNVNEQTPSCCSCLEGKLWIF